MKDQNILPIVLVYLVIINVVAFLVFGLDKWRARHSKWRISEATLLALAVVGGSVGAWLGMRVWHHKTLHKKFKYGIPLILAAQLALLLLTSCKTKQTIEPSVPVEAQRMEAEHSPDVFLVMYDEQVGKAPLLEAVKEYKCEVKYDYRLMNGMALRKPADKTLEATMQLFRRVKGVIAVEYDHIYRLTDPVRPKLEVK